MRPRNSVAPNVPKLAYSIPEAAFALGIGRSTLDKLIADGEIATFPILNRRHIRASVLDAYIASREEAA